MSDKSGWEGRGQQMGTRIGTVWTLSQALGQAKKNKYALEPPKGYIVSGCWQLKRKFWLTHIRTAVVGLDFRRCGRFSMVTELLDVRWDVLGNANLV